MIFLAGRCKRPVSPKTGRFPHSENWVRPEGTPVQFTDDPALAGAILRAEEDPDSRSYACVSSAAPTLCTKSSAPPPILPGAARNAYRTLPMHTRFWNRPRSSNSSLRRRSATYSSACRNRLLSLLHKSRSTCSCRSTSFCAWRMSATPWPGHHPEAFHERHAPDDRPRAQHRGRQLRHHRSRGRARTAFARPSGRWCGG